MRSSTSARPVWQRLLVVLVGAGLGLSLLPGATSPAAAGDGAEPETWIVRYPVDPTTSRKVIFEHYSPTTQAFQCRLDDRRWRACWIEAKYKGLELGRHVFRVRAVDDGVKDPTPARFRWTIVEAEEEAAGAAPRAGL